MKTEDNHPQPQASQPAPTQTTFSAAQWGQTQMPIDPALQQQPQHATAPTYQYHPYSHYPQAQYSSYHHYAPPQQQQHQQPVAHAQATQPAAVARPVTAQPMQPIQTQTQNQQQSNGMDTADIATLNDALGSAGVDLRAEEESLHRSADQYHQYRPYEDRSRKQPSTPSFDPRILGPIIRAHGTQHKVTTIREDSINYVALALRFRLQEILEAMIAASKHRTDAQWERDPGLYEDGTPMWGVVVRSDVAKQLAAIEKVEREEEMKIRRERKERAEAAAQAIALAQQASTSAMSVDGAGASNEDAEGGPKKKKKKEGPGVTARNMSEDVRKKMSNAVASQAAGLSTQKYAWMSAASSAPASKPKAAATAAATTTTGGGTPGLTPATTTAPAASATSGSGWARPYVPATSKTGQLPAPQKGEDPRRVVTLRDALFVVEKERGHGGGKGSARGWT